MNDAPDPFAFPDLNDEAIIALNDFLEEFYTCFQNHYFAQMHRYDRARSRPDRYNDQMTLPLDDPPF